MEGSVLESLFNKVSDASSLHFYWKETPTRVFSREFCLTFKSSFSTEHFRMTASLDAMQNLLL